MQVSRSNHALAYLLPLQRDAARERAPSEQVPQPPNPPSRGELREVRDVEEIQAARRIFNQFRSQGDFSVMKENARQERAAAAYRSLQTQDEQAYVREVLGIDVYA